MPVQIHTKYFDTQSKSNPEQKQDFAKILQIIDCGRYGIC